MNRVSSIDIARGLVILIMIIEHIVHLSPFISVITSPIQNIENINPIFLVIRILSHLCAPGFVILCGISVYFRQSHYDTKTFRKHLLKRGFILILLESTIITFGWSFSIIPYKIFLQVIFAIGCGLILLSFLVGRLAPKQILLFSLTLIFLDAILYIYGNVIQQFLPSFLFAVLHEKTVFWLFNEKIMIRTTFPILSWCGVIGVGYFLGQFYSNKEINTHKVTAISCFLLFISLVTRLLDISFFNQNSLQVNQNPFIAAILFLDLLKYPPSILFLSTYISAFLLVLNTIRKYNFKLKLLEFLGKNSLKIYIIHLYVITAFYKILKMFI